MERYDMEKLYEKAGGAFRLTVLVQKRLKQLNAGAPKLVDLESKNPRDVVYQEILDDKIWLIPDEHGGASEEIKVSDMKDMFQKKRSELNLQLKS